MKFSVLIPVYIKEKPEFLKMSLDSVLIHQTIVPSEIIIVEDGPLNIELNKVLKDYQNSFPEIFKVFKLKENKGMGYAMNYGLDKCNNEWVFRMDSDDISISTRFEDQINIIKNNKYDVIGSSISEFNFAVGDLNQLRVMPENHERIVNLLKTRNPINHMTVAFRKSKALEAKGYWDKRYFEDYNLWYEMYKIGAKFYNIQTPLVNARIGNNMVARRSGYAYYKYEKELISKFLADKFITKLEYLSIMTLKYVLRILPVPILKIVYKNVLRKSI
jgi:glycosyltransferase involved in cell wall biosynthesis